MRRTLLASLCVSLTLILASSATGTAPTPDLSAPQITPDIHVNPLPPYTKLHIDRHLHDRSPSESATVTSPSTGTGHRKALKQFNIHSHDSVRRHRRHNTVSKTITAPADKPTSTQAPGAAPEKDYVKVFKNLAGAIQADGYMTYGLVKTVDECKAFCDRVPGCMFANSYRDVHGKGGSADLTCSLYNQCHNAAKTTNRGGQSQPDGSLNHIVNSDGWCKARATV